MAVLGTQCLQRCTLQPRGQEQVCKEALPRGTSKHPICLISLLRKFLLVSWQGVGV